MGVTYKQLKSIVKTTESSYYLKLEGCRVCMEWEEGSNSSQETAAHQLQCNFASVGGGATAVMAPQNQSCTAEAETKLDNQLKRSYSGKMYMKIAR